MVKEPDGFLFTALDINKNLLLTLFNLELQKRTIICS